MNAERPTLRSLLSAAARARLRRLAEPPARLLLAVGLGPDAVTLLGALLCLLAGIVAAAGLPIAAAALFLVGGLCDGLDGTMARISGRASAFGAYLDSLTDRLGEITLFAGIAVGGASGALVPEAPALTAGAAALALGLGLLVSYARARAEGIGVPIGEQGLAQRGERAALVVTGLLLGALVTPFLLTVSLDLLVLLAAITVAQRVLAVRRALRIRDIPGAERR